MTDGISGLEKEDQIICAHVCISQTRYDLVRHFPGSSFAWSCIFSSLSLSAEHGAGFLAWTE